MNSIQKAASLMGKKGGRATGGLKAETSRANGRKGGSPRKYAPCPGKRAHRWDTSDHCRYCGARKIPLDKNQTV